MKTRLGPDYRDTLREYRDSLREHDHYLSLYRFGRDPFKWLGKWVVGKVVYLTCMGLRFALLAAYYDIFRSWWKNL